MTEGREIVLTRITSTEHDAPIDLHEVGHPCAKTAIPTTKAGWYFQPCTPGAAELLRKGGDPRSPNHVNGGVLHVGSLTTSWTPIQPVVLDLERHAVAPTPEVLAEGKARYARWKELNVSA